MKYSSLLWVGMLWAIVGFLAYTQEYQGLGLVFIAGGLASYIADMVLYNISKVE